MAFPSIYKALVLALGLTKLIRGHSFVREVREMQNGDFMETIGYARGYSTRSL
jgi:hypothetical protein